MVTEGISPEQAVDEAIARIKSYPERIANPIEVGLFRERHYLAPSSGYYRGGRHDAA
jgi:hypothetical protein